MKKRGLLSWPFLCLYAAAIFAVVLSAGRSHWAPSGWYPTAVGGTAALAIIPLRYMFQKRLLDRSAGDWLRIVFFFFLALATLAAAVFFIKTEVFLLGCGMLLMSALFTWSALGTFLEWPGFRRPPQAERMQQMSLRPDRQHERGLPRMR
jgi:small-conductance mechanosensitive channel